MRARLAWVLPTLLLSGCAAWSDGPGFYWQAMVGHLEVMQRTRPLPEVLADPGTDAVLRARLARAQEIRSFASETLGLPAGGSYTAYAALDRPYVVWSVFATPPLSLELERWCFPIAGCVAYRGYPQREAADAFAERLRAKGLEVQVSGVPAYSTLGWLDDPLLSTFIHYPETELVRLIFHELAHQQVYVSGDTAFNESFATAVEEAGVARWLQHRADPALAAAWRAQSERRADFLALLRAARRSLETLYASDLSRALKEAGKAQVLDGLTRDYQALKARWGTDGGYDRFFERGPSNPQLAAVGVYTDWVPAFHALLREAGGDWSRFYQAVKALAAQPAAEREARLRALLPAGTAVREDRT